MLIELFKTEERARVLGYVMFRSSFSVAEVSRATGVTKGLVSRYLCLLMEHGLLQKEVESILLMIALILGPSNSCSTCRE